MLNFIITLRTGLKSVRAGELSPVAKQTSSSVLLVLGLVLVSFPSSSLVA